MVFDPGKVILSALHRFTKSGQKGVFVQAIKKVVKTTCEVSSAAKTRGGSQRLEEVGQIRDKDAVAFSPKCHCV